MFVSAVPDRECEHSDAAAYRFHKAPGGDALEQRFGIRMASPTTLRDRP